MKKNIVVIVLGVTLGILAASRCTSKKLVKKCADLMEELDKHCTLFLMMNQWIRIKQDGKSIVSYFEKNKYRKIAIYGMGAVGVTLMKELEETSIHIAYGIDKNAKSICTGLEVVTVEEPFNKVDAVVVTAVTYFDEIREMLSKKMTCPIVSLEDILYGI